MIDSINFIKHGGDALRASKPTAYGLLAAYQQNIN
jgi:hypothetical protein